MSARFANDSSTNARTRGLRSAFLAFALIASLYLIDVLVLQSVPEVAYAYAANYALPFDLMVGVPLIVYLLVIRRKKLTPLLVLPMMWAGGAASALLAVPGQLSLVPMFAAGCAVVEITIAVREIRRMVAGYRAARADGSRVHACFTAAFCVLMKNESAARIAALELTMWRYVLFSWRDQPDVPEGYQPFFYHHKSSYATVVGMVLGAVAMHLLLMKIDLLLACVLTVLSLYTAVWILGDMRGVMLNPILVGHERLVVRWGIFRSISVPAAMVSSVTRNEPDLPKKLKLNLGVMGMPSCWVVLEESLETTTMFGRHRLYQAFGLSPDDELGLKAAIKSEKGALVHE